MPKFNDSAITRTTEREKIILRRKLYKEGYTDEQIEKYLSRLDDECKNAHKYAQLLLKTHNGKGGEFKEEFEKLTM